MAAADADRDLTRNLLHAGGIVVLAYVVAIVFVSLGAAILRGVTGLGLDAAPVMYNTWGSVLQFAGFVVAAGWYLHQVDPDVLRVRRPGLRTAGWVVGGFALLLVASTATSIVVSLLGVEAAQNQVLELGRENPVFLLYMIPVAIFLVGPGEELVFRGVVQGRLVDAFGRWPGIVAASAVFGVAHWLALIGTGSGKLVYIGIAAMLGLVLGTVYEYSENILVPIVIHGLWNAMLFAANWYLIVNDVPLPT